VGDFEAETLVLVESSLKYHPCKVEALTQVRNPDRGQCVLGSLTGAVVRPVALPGSYVRNG